jgi:NIMA (never in mitosis gene a)-related kinase
MSLANFDIVNKLGDGAFSGVFRVVRKSDGQLYALKKVKLHALKQKEKENSLNEVRILASFNHPNIIAYKEAFIEEKENCLCIVMELADHGDLLKKITDKKTSGTYFHEEEIWQALVQITDGLKTLHNASILHRDLKGANIFITKDGTMKLGDLNVSKVNKRGLAYTQTGTPYYASPEVWQDKPYDWRSDIWSLGCVIYEMTALSPPFTANDMKGLYNKVTSGQYPNIPSRFSADLSNTIRSMLQVNPILRPSCDKILEMPTVRRHISHVSSNNNEPLDLLGTIKFESALRNIQKKLPASNYETDNKYIPSTMPQIDEIINKGGSRSDRVPSTNSQQSPKYRNNPILNEAPLNGPGNHQSAIANHLLQDSSHRRVNSKEHVPVVKGELPTRQRANVGGMSPPSIPKYPLGPIRKSNSIEEIKGSPKSDSNSNPLGRKPDIYNNYPEIRPPQPPPQSTPLSRGQNPSSGSRNGTGQSRPNSNLHKAGNYILQSPKQLLPKGNVIPKSQQKLNFL